MNKRVLIIGAGGFIGGFIVEQALRRGYETWAGVRGTTSRRYLSDERIKFIELDFDNPSTLADTLRTALPEGERWDYIIYNLGATKCTNFADFNRINYRYTADFIAALDKASMQPTKFLYMSSLSVLGPGDEIDYKPFDEHSIPQPDTRYGASKLKAEVAVMSSSLPYIIFRTTGVYGPRERDYFLMFKSISKGFDFSVGFRKQLLTFIYVEDLTRAMFDALEKAPVKKTYIIAEPRSYTQGEFRKIVAHALNRRFVVPMVMPLWAVYAVSVAAQTWGLIRMKPSTLNRDKFNIMKQRNWSADVSAAERDFGFRAEVDLQQGVERCIKWYKENSWL